MCAPGSPRQSCDRLYAGLSSDMVRVRTQIFHRNCGEDVSRGGVLLSRHREKHLQSRWLRSPSHYAARPIVHNETPFCEAATATRSFALGNGIFPRLAPRERNRGTGSGTSVASFDRVGLSMPIGRIFTILTSSTAFIPGSGQFRAEIKQSASAGGDERRTARGYLVR